MNKFVIPLVLTAILLIGLAMFISCQMAPNAPPDKYADRFTFERYEPSQTQCVVNVITDKETGCKYLQVCNDIASMPHTCFLDKQ